MSIEVFPAEVHERLKYYVYRLIDPRNGETFYVGKGKGNRVFNHAQGEIDKNDDTLSEKLKRIYDIKNAGFQVAHVIHRHGLDEPTAFHVEAALMDAYPATHNIAGGKNNGEQGIMHADEIVEKYAAEEAVFRHRLIAITINRSAAETSVYEAVRYAWKIGKTRAEKSDHVLAVINGMIVNVFTPTQWMEATPANFPGLSEIIPGRIGFVGREADAGILALYQRKRIPSEMRKRGVANPIRYIEPQKSEDS